METPLFTALLQHSKRKPLSMHVPGHKNGKLFLEEAKSYYKDILRLDVTELTGLDDLHHPSEAIAHAQELTAALYGVTNSYFLVNGSTVGNLAMILSCLGDNDYVLVQRNSHKSIMNGIQLAGAKPIFLEPKIDEQYQIPVYVELETIIEAIKLYPSAKALILTNPNYYGLTTNLKEIIELAHDKDIPVLVDEAHGAHFIAGDPFPASAIKSGADIVIHSAHKTLPAMTMGSYLHFNSSRIDKERLEFYLSALQSSSPSYPIMASLDLARAYLEEIIRNKKQVDILQGIKLINEAIKSVPGLELVESRDRFLKKDPLKLTIRSNNGLSGYELKDIFESKNIYAELADPLNLLLILPFGSLNGEIDKIASLKEILPKGFHNRVHKKQSTRRKSRIQTIEKSFTYLKKLKKNLVSFDEAIGHYAAETVTPYPPGIPFLMVGDKITREILQELKELVDSGATIQGDQHVNMGKISIYRREEEGI